MVGTRISSRTANRLLIISYFRVIRLLGARRPRPLLSICASIMASVMETVTLKISLETVDYLNTYLISIFSMAVMDTRIMVFGMVIPRMVTKLPKRKRSFILNTSRTMFSLVNRLIARELVINFGEHGFIIILVSRQFISGDKRSPSVTRLKRRVVVNLLIKARTRSKLRLTCVR